MGNTLGIAIGSNIIKAIKVGETNISKIYIGNKLLGTSGGELPSGYTQLNYIETTSVTYKSNYINTGFIPNQNTDIEMKIQAGSNITSSSSWEWDRVFGADTNFLLTLNYSQYNCPIFGFKGKEYLLYDDEIWGLTDGVQIASGYSSPGIDEFLSNNKTMSLKMGKSGIEINDVQMVSTLNGDDFTSPSPIWLFSQSDGGDRDARLKLFYCKIYDDGLLVRDLIPCKNPNDVVGMYDLVNKTFYQNEGNTPFLYG